jgi:hypothetical protein
MNNPTRWPKNNRALAKATTVATGSRSWNQFMEIQLNHNASVVPQRLLWKRIQGCANRDHNFMLWFEERA